MSEQTLVEKPAVDPTPAAVPGAQSQQVDTTSDASASTQQAKTEVVKSFEDTLAEQFAKSEKPPEPTPEETDAEREIRLSNTTEKEKEEAETPPEEEVKGEEEPPETEKGPVPYERFHEVVEKQRVAEQQVEQLVPKAQAHDGLMRFCEENQLSKEDFNSAMELAVLFKHDPAAFHAKIKPILEGTGVLAGETLPQDLQAKVEAGTLELEDAKELARYRAKEQWQGNVKKETAAQTEARQRTQFVENIGKTWMDWSKSMEGKYPDFKPGSSLFTMVNDRMTALTQQLDAQGRLVNPINSPDDALKIANAAFEFVVKSVKGIIPKPVAKRAPLTSNGSSARSTNKDPMKAPTFEEALMMTAEQKGFIRK